MAHCKIIYPGLLGPDVPLEELPRSEWPDTKQLPLLSLLFTRGKLHAQPKTSLEHQLLSNMGYVLPPLTELPVAALRQQGGEENTTQLWCLDPVYVQIDREIAYLAAADELDLSEQEARQFIATINQHFADELHIRYHKPQQWLLEKKLQLSTYTPTEAMLQDVNHMQPVGEDARSWSSLLNEIQMLLHAHPINAARMDNNQQPVNSLWLWGGGDIHATDPGIDMVYSNNTLAADAAVRNAIAHEPLPDSIDEAVLNNRKVLIVMTEQLLAIQQKDVYGWFEALKQLEQYVLTPLFAMLKKGTLQELILYSDHMSLAMSKRDLIKWWRGSTSMDKTILQLRKTYAH